MIWHRYADGVGLISSFDPAEDITPLLSLWKKCGAIDLIPFREEQRAVSSFTLSPREGRRVFEAEGAGLICGIRVLSRGFDRAMLKQLCVIARWDGEAVAAVDADFGCFFSNELGCHDVKYLLAGMNTDGEFRNCFPMPYRSGAVMEIVNRGDRSITLDYVGIRHTEEYNGFYRENPFCVFRTAPYAARKRTVGRDSRIALVKGSGHMVSALITGYGIAGGVASCEGDVRLLIDGIRTPQVESDGSESYACYGWGFPTEPECNPGSGYDGEQGFRAWSETRLFMGDVNPFYSELCLNIESGGNNDWPMEHSGMVFYYGSDRVRLVRLGRFPAEGERTTLTSYFEGDDDDVAVTLTGSYRQPASFTVEIPDGTEHLVIRRVSDQQKGRQSALVRVDGQPVTEYRWYTADHNPVKRWLEDEYMIPSRCTDGKKQVTISISPEDGGEGVTFNSFGYEVFAILS